MVISVFFSVLASELMTEERQIHSFEPYFVYQILEQIMKLYAPETRVNRLGLSDEKKKNSLEKISGDSYAKKYFSTVSRKNEY